MPRRASLQVMPLQVTCANLLGTLEVAALGQKHCSEGLQHLPTALGTLALAQAEVRAGGTGPAAHHQNNIDQTNIRGPKGIASQQVPPHPQFTVPVPPLRYTFQWMLLSQRDTCCNNAARPRHADAF
jgi:hypothetical protein